MRYALILLLTGCAMTSGVMESEGGTYLISARAAPARGGSAGANQVAYEEAMKFCAGKGGRAIVVNQNERDVQEGAIGGSGNSFAGGSFAGGAANLRFRCQ